MPNDPIPDFETRDLLGTSDSFAATVGTTLTAVPADAGKVIQSYLIICKIGQTPATKQLLFYTDGGTNPKTIGVGGHVSGKLKGDKKQIHIKGNQAGVEYEIELNREP